MSESSCDLGEGSKPTPILGRELDLQEDWELQETAQLTGGLNPGELTSLSQTRWAAAVWPGCFVSDSQRALPKVTASSSSTFLF